MGMWIKRSKDTLHSIIDHVKAENEGLTVRVGFVAYRDFCDGKNRLNVTDFTTDIDAIKKKIQGQRATGGGDMPEDVQGGLNKALGLSWQPNSVKSAFHIADAPGHGKDINGLGGYFFGLFGGGGDSYPNGSPEGFKLQDQMREFGKRNIVFSFVKVNESCNAMIKVMEENYNPSGNTMNVTDLSKACQS